MAAKPANPKPATPPAEGGQNVTLHLPKELLRKAKSVAAARGMSLSKFLAEGMEQLLKNEDAYWKAYRSWKADVTQNKHDGGGSTAKSRDELHERR